MLPMNLGNDVPTNVGHIPQRAPRGLTIDDHLMEIGLSIRVALECDEELTLEYLSRFLDQLKFIGEDDVAV